MITFLTRRFLQLIPVLWGVATIVFFLLHLVPGDPVDIMLGESALSTSKEALRQQLRLDQPLWEQYVHYWRGLIRGDLGTSLLSKRPVAELIQERLPATIQLALLALLLAVSLAIPLGIVSAIHKHHWTDRLIMLFTLVGISMPSFWFGTLLVFVFAVHLNILPVSERSGFDSFILPVATLGISMTAILCRMTRASMLDVLGNDYIQTARAKGLSEFAVLTKHALKNSIVPVITIVGLQLGSLLSGAVITETIFDWPGLGELLYRGIQARDYPLVQGCVLVVACAYVGANTLADIAYSIANPKVRLE